MPNGRRRHHPERSERGPAPGGTRRSLRRTHRLKRGGERGVLPPRPRSARRGENGEHGKAPAPPAPGLRSPRSGRASSAAAGQPRRARTWHRRGLPRRRAGATRGPEGTRPPCPAGSAPHPAGGALMALGTARSCARRGEGRAEPRERAQEGPRSSAPSQVVPGVGMAMAMNEAQRAG